MDKRLTIQ